MNKTHHFETMLYSFLCVAVILLTGCAEASGSAADQGSGVTGDPDGTYSTENTGDAPSEQTDTETLPPDDSGSTAAEDWQYSWQEITITLPARWKDLCVIQENPNGFSLFQKASYEENNDGYICSFMRTSEYLNYGVGETLLAYTDDGQFYYLMQPTDFACASENKDIMDEYSQMCSQVYSLTASL